MVSQVNLVHDFSVELESKHCLRNISISNDARETVLFEGTLGESIELSLEEGNVLEIKGKNGVLRVSISENQVSNVLDRYRKNTRTFSETSKMDVKL